MKNIGREAADIVKQGFIIGRLWEIIFRHVLKADKPRKGEHSGTEEETVLF